MNTLTEFYVHNAMIDFLYNYEKRRYGYGTLQEILCELNPLPQGGTSNPAVWEEWNRCVDACLKEIIMKTSYGETAHRVYTKLQAFNAMVDFFINYYQRTSDGDLRTLMEVICALSKDNTAPILQAEWNNAVRKALQNKNNQKFTDKFVERKLTKLQAFNAAVKFLDDYYKKTGLDIICLLGDMLFWPDGSTADPAFWFEWNDAVKKILKKQTEKKM